MAGKKQRTNARTPRRKPRPRKHEGEADLWGDPVVRLLSLRQYARKRGVTLQAVQKAIQSGRIETEPGGKINPALADEQWQTNTDTTRNPSPEFGGDGNVGGGGQSEQLRNARMVRAIYEARLIRIKFDEKAATLVNRTDVYKKQFAAARRLRDKLLSLGDRIAPMVKGKASITEIAEAANAEVRTTLREFVEELEDVSDDTTAD